jgi:hypothetical protein
LPQSGKQRFAADGPFAGLRRDEGIKKAADITAGDHHYEDKKTTVFVSVYPHFE